MNSLDPDQTRHLSGLAWFQAICKGYWQDPDKARHFVGPAGSRFLADD